MIIKELPPIYTLPLERLACFAKRVAVAASDTWTRAAGPSGCPEHEGLQGRGK